jgi:hypothetical protein
MDHHDIGTFENWASTESIGTILTNATPDDVQPDLVLTFMVVLNACALDARA